jgi:hypothetical protein
VNLKEDHKEIKSGKIKDHEGYMANLEFDQIERSLSVLRKVVKKPTDQLPAWVQSKITRAADFIDTAAEYLSSDEEISEGLVSKVVDKIKGRKQVGTTASGGKIYVSTRNKPSNVKYPSSPKPQQKNSSAIDHDDPWLKHSSGQEKKAHYRQMRGEEVENFSEEKEMRFCKACGKEETRDECSYGPKIWDKYSIKKMSESVLDINEEFNKMF